MTEKNKIRVGDYTSAGFVLWIDDYSPRIPDPLVKVSSTGLCTHRLSELEPMPVPEGTEREVEIPDNFGQKEVLTLLTKMAMHFRNGNGFGPHSTVNNFVKHWLTEQIKKKL